MVAPLTVSVCEFALVVGSPATFPTAVATMNFHTTATTKCPQGPSGADAPGGFGWLDVGASPCSLTVPAESWVSADPGNSAPHSCDLTTWQNADITIPIYNAVTGQGNNTTYHVVGFGRFHVTGYKFPGKRWTIEGTTLSCPGESGNSGTCVRGWFTRFENDARSIYKGSSFGVSGVMLVG